MKTISIDADLLNLISDKRVIRLKNAPAYLGMDKNRFNREIRPYLVPLPIGKRGVAFDRFDLDAWVEQYKQLCSCPGADNRRHLWARKEYQDFKKSVQFGTSTRGSTATDFAKVLEQVTSKKRKNI